LSAFDLAVVRAAVLEDRVEVGGPRFKEKLLPHLRTYVAMHAFTKAVLLELTHYDYMKSVPYEGVDYDEYGIAISTGLQERFAIEGLETWYVKFTLDEGFDGEVVLMASLHEPEWPLRRAGGTIPVRFARRME
jgi:hypothetical protein